MNTVSKNGDRIEKAVLEILKEIGEDPERQGLQKTPERISKMFKDLTSGYSVSPQKVVNGAIFEEKYDEMVIVRDIEFYSLCEHPCSRFSGNVM